LSAYHFYFYFLSFSPFFFSQIRQQLEIEHISSIEHNDGGLGGILVQGKCGEEKGEILFSVSFYFELFFWMGNGPSQGRNYMGLGIEVLPKFLITPIYLLLLFKKNKKIKSLKFYIFL